MDLADLRKEEAEVRGGGGRAATGGGGGLGRQLVVGVLEKIT